MSTPGRTATKAFLWLNMAAGLAFAYLAVVQPEITDTEVRMRYTHLDREGVINESALERIGLAPGSGRSTVPLFIAGPALRAQRANALWALALAVSNAILAVVLLAARPDTHRQ